MEQLDIRKTKTYVLSLHDQNNNRRKDIEEHLKTLDVENWQFFDAIDVRGKLPYWVGCGLSHRECLVGAEYPCIVYEDDVISTSWFRPIVECTNDAILYLGLSQWGTSSGTSQLHGTEFSVYSDELSVVKHMVSAHAIYYPNREIAMKFSDGIVRCMLEHVRPFDEHYALMQTKEKTLCLNQPLFYQNDPKTKHYTNIEVQL